MALLFKKISGEAICSRYQRAYRDFEYGYGYRIWLGGSASYVNY